MASKGKKNFAKENFMSILIQICTHLAYGKLHHRPLCVPGMHCPVPVKEISLIKTDMKHQQLFIKTS